MNNKIQLKKYLLHNFFKTLVFIGIAEALLNTIMKYLLNPLIENIVSIDGLLTQADITKTFQTLFQSVIIFTIEKLAANVSFLAEMAVNHVIQVFFDRHIIQSVTMMSNKLSGLETWLYIVTVLGLFILVFALWLLPYIIGGVYFSRSVNKKVNEIEAARIAKDKEYDRQRNLLLSDVAHDIKTPITTVAGFSRALSDGTVAREQEKEYLDAIYYKSMQVSDLVSLLFEYVKLDSIGYSLQKTTEDFCELVRGCIARLYTDFEQKQMELEIDIPEESIFLQVDKTQMERAINNLLVNTIKHNPEHTKVMISLFQRQNQVILDISDLGVFIERETAEHLFDPFVQGDKSRTSKSGTGLGLSISKKIIDMHYGQIVLIQYKHPENHGKTKTFEMRLYTN